MVITGKDLQPKFESAFDNMNKVRKAWVSVITTEQMESIRKKFKDPSSRFEFYKIIDGMVIQRHIDTLKQYRESVIARGHDLVIDADGKSRLPDALCIDPDDNIISSAQHVVCVIVSEFKL
ncbi:RNA polymerase binding [Pseudomonas phage PspYZU05]|uniref:RNA polymerase binding protein n=1 Tax=Pseudomonas phage PspYZU05 TaxID=1983556 RepID=A0A2U7N2G2_9CAUD|nr:RNA polymerase binding [Pseudomonas phage PspYZU05]ASD52040.1 RNA polymerase binding protein [Pseudomonas phage PspYZU05]